MLEDNLHGTTTEYCPVPTGEPELSALLRDARWRRCAGAAFRDRDSGGRPSDPAPPALP